MMFRLLYVAAAISLTCIAASSYAQKLPVTIPGTTMPWNYGAKLNHNRDYGENNGTAPVVVTLADLGASPGQTLLIKYVSGTICPGGYPCVDAKGYPGFITNHNTGNSGTYFPSRYVAKEPTYLEELIGVFTDAEGKIIGRPFAIADRGAPTIPAKATQLQLGANDDIYSDNSGSWLLSVSVR